MPIFVAIVFIYLLCGVISAAWALHQNGETFKENLDRAREELYPFETDEEANLLLFQGVVLGIVLWPFRSQWQDDE